MISLLLDQEKVVKKGAGLNFSIDVECPGEFLSVTDFENDIVMEMQAHSTYVNTSMYCDDHVTVSFKTECVYLFDRDAEGNKALFMHPKEMQLGQSKNCKHLKILKYQILLSFLLILLKLETKQSKNGK